MQDIFFLWLLATAICVVYAIVAFVFVYAKKNRKAR